MEMTISWKILLVLITTFKINSSIGSIIKLLIPSEVSIIDDAMIHIIENCFPEIRNIFFWGEHNVTTIKTIKNINKFATVQLESLSLMKKMDYYHKKIDLMIVIDHQLENIKPKLLQCNDLKTPTNQIMVFMICKNEEVNESFISNFLRLWSCRFFIVYALCLNSKHDLKIYTFNPYTNRTAYMWEKVALKAHYSKIQFSNRWTLHYRPYVKEHICQGFNFDRVKYLDGIQVIGGTSLLSSPGSQETEEIIEKAINMSIIRKKGNSGNGNKLDKIYRSYDTIFARYSSNSSNESGSLLTISQPLSYYSMKILTHNRRLLTPLEKIYDYYGYLTVISTVIILAITFTVIYLSDHDFTFAVFEILRLLINTGIKTRIDTGKSRIFFSMIFLYFLIIHGTFNGRLAGFLTKAKYRKNVESIEDLEDLQYTKIYANFTVQKYLRDHYPKMKNKSYFRRRNCENAVKTDFSAVCIDNDYLILPMVRSLELHAIKSHVLTGYDAFRMHKNWPLASRVNDVAIWGLHSGLSYKWSRDRIAKDVHRIETLKARSFVPYRPIAVADLQFSFILLGIGLSLSMICFIIEILLKRKKNFKRHRRVKLVHIQRWIFAALLNLKIEVSFRKFIHYLRRKK